MTVSGTDTIRSASVVAGASILVAGLVTLLKFLAYLITGSVALYSDALESIVNVVTAAAALVAVRVSAQPADRDHPFGHHKAEYVAAVLEGSLIVVAAFAILHEASGTFFHPHPLESPGKGILITAIASVINAGWGSYLVARGRHWRSPALIADGWHMLTDVWTSAGVLVGLGLALATGAAWLDPVIGALVACHILWSGARLTMGSLSGLMDQAVSPALHDEIQASIKAHAKGALQVHDIRTRVAGSKTFIEFHLVVPGQMSVRESHAICDRLEDALEGAIPGAEVLIHVEPDSKAKPAGALEI